MPIHDVLYGTDWLCTIAFQLAYIAFQWGKSNTEPIQHVKCSQWVVQNSSMSAFVTLSPPPSLEDPQIACIILASIKPLFFCTYYAVVYLQGGRGPSRIERDRMKLALLEEAHIVCSTLSFSGSGLFAQMSRKFDVVVIDEAAQAVEPAILVPLVQGVKQVSQSSAPMLHLQTIQAMCRARTGQ